MNKKTQILASVLIAIPLLFGISIFIIHNLSVNNSIEETSRVDDEKITEEFEADIDSIEAEIEEEYFPNSDQSQALYKITEDNLNLYADNSTCPGIIYDFYNFINLDELDKAFSIGGQGREFSTFENLYRDTKLMLTQCYSKNDDTTYNVSVYYLDKSYDSQFYDVEITVDNDFSKIVNSSSEPVNDIEFKCTENVFKGKEIRYYCYSFRNGESFPFVNSARDGVEFYGHFKDSESVYLSRTDAAIAESHTSLYSYNIITNEFKYIGSFSYTVPYPIIEECKLFENSSQIYNVEDFYKDCLIKYSNEDWYSGSLEYAENYHLFPNSYKITL